MSAGGLGRRPPLRLGEPGAVGGHSERTPDSKARMSQLAPLVYKIPAMPLVWHDTARLPRAGRPSPEARTFDSPSCPCPRAQNPRVIEPQAGQPRRRPLKPYDLVGSDLVCEVSRKGKQEKANENPIFRFKVSYSGSGIASVADARVVRAKPVESLEGFPNRCMGPKTKAITQASEGAHLSC